MRLSFLFIIFISCGCFAQSLLIQGIIKDSLSGHSVPYAAVKIVNSPHGTLSDENGKYVISADSGSSFIEVSSLGYEKKTISVSSGNKDNLIISLVPRTYETAMIDVPPLTWAEKFISNTIKINSQKNSELNYFKAEVYSKTTFSQNTNQIIGLIESVSELNFDKPDRFQERVIAAKIPPHMKNLPYSSVAINQQININSDYLKLQNIYIVSPLNKEALKYYDFSLIESSKPNNDSIVSIEIKPRTSSIPLFQGQLSFNAGNYQLLEANLWGNEEAKTAIFDSLQLFQKYQIQDSAFNLPVFSRCAVRINCIGFNITFDQECTLKNYRINDSNNKPKVSVNYSLIEDLQPAVDLDLKRDSFFKVPLSSNEQMHKNLIDSVFFKTSPLKRALLYTVLQFPALLLDETVNIGELDIKHFSNWYHFNKADGHYLGFEFNGYQNEYSTMHVNAGYGFSSRLFSLNLFFGWSQFYLKINRSINNLGNFPYNRSLHTFDALINHEDNYNYYISQFLKLEYSIPVLGNLIVTPFIQFEKQMPVESLNEFSLFNRNKQYGGNFTIYPYNNNKTGLLLSYNQESAYEGKTNYSSLKGRSFTDFEAYIDLASKSLINSDENGYNFNFMLHRHQEIHPAVNLELSFFFQKQSGTSAIQNMSFVNSLQTEENNNSALSFFTLYNYQYFTKDFFRVKAETSMFKFPEFLSFRMTVGAVYSFLRPIGKPINDYFSTIENDFHEYGISLKGISFVNFYLLKNNLYNNIYFRLNFGF